MEKHIDNESTSSAGSLIQIPFNQLSPTALDSILEEFITREGTNYGFYEYSVTEQMSKAKAMLEKGKVSIVFDPVLERCHIIDARQLAELKLLTE
tara:strand:+ start:1100 stop:1384 length:285 start_codon:yes stop_codon:yes gene_type:complete